MKPINAYPDAIANLEVDLLNLSDQIDTQSHALEDYNAAIEVAIATDADLKNDQQRKARRLELQHQDHYQLLLKEMRRLNFEQRMLAIKVEQARNQFAVAKINTRLEIARLSLSSDW